jgi:hypothetical protein
MREMETECSSIQQIESEHTYHNGGRLSFIYNIYRHLVIIVW